VPFISNNQPSMLFVTGMIYVLKQLRLIFLELIDFQNFCTADDYIKQTSKVFFLYSNIE